MRRVPGLGPKKAAALHRDGQFEQAEAAYRELLKRNPQDVAVLRLLGLLAIDTGHFRNAAEVLDHALAALLEKGSKASGTARPRALNDPDG